MLKLNLSYSSSVNFAMQQNHVPIIKNIHIINEDDESIDDIKITLSFVPNLTDKIERYIDTISEKLRLRLEIWSFLFLQNTYQS